MIDFQTSWFSIVMGMGVFITSTYLLGVKFSIDFLITLARILSYLNFTLFLFLISIFILKFIFFFPLIKKDFTDPIKANFYVTLGIAALSLATNFYEVLNKQILYYPLWIFGALTVNIIVIINMMNSFLGSHIRIEHINPSWFLMSTGLLLVPGTGIGIAKLLGYGDFTIPLFDFSFGTGLLLYLALFSVWIYRFILHEPLKGDRLPLFWINLGPIGASLTSLINYYYSTSLLKGVVSFFLILFFGAGSWWFLISLIVTMYYIRRVNISYKTIWWSFVFPLGQFLVAAILLENYNFYSNLEWYLIFLYAVLVSLWVTNIIMTFISLLHREKSSYL